MKDAIVENARLRARLSRIVDPNELKPVDVVITANEINDRHGTGVLLQRILDGGNLFSIRSRDDWGVADFGRWTATISQRGFNRPEWFRNVLRVLAGRTIGNVMCVPFLPEEAATAITIEEIFGARLCTYLMDDQNVLVESIPDPLMRELLEKSVVRFATHPELRAAYEQKYGLKFFLLPAVVPDDLIARETVAPAILHKHGAMIGSIWDQTWLDQLCAALPGEWTIDWFGNHRFWSLDASAAALVKSGIAAHGVIPERQLAAELRKYPFAIVPVAASAQSNRGELALSLPGRILFAMAASQTPILVIGSEQSCAARFVGHFGIGVAAPYEARKVAAAMQLLSDPENQRAMRSRAAAIGMRFSDRGVKPWVRASMERGHAADSRFEDAFAGYNG